MKPLVIIGLGSQGRLALSIARQRNREVLKFVNAFEGTECPEEVNGVPATQTLFCDAPNIACSADVELVIAVADRERKRELAIQYSQLCCKFAKLVSGAAYVDRTAVVGAGSIIAPLSVVGPDACVGGHVKIGSGCVVSCGCKIEEYAALSSGVSLGERVTVGEGALLGVGAVILPYVRIGAWSTVGPGSVVIEDVLEHVTVLGNPAGTISVNRTWLDVMEDGLLIPRLERALGARSQEYRRTLSEIVGGARQAEEEAMEGIVYAD